MTYCDFFDTRHEVWHFYRCFMFCGIPRSTRGLWDSTSCRPGPWRVQGGSYHRERPKTLHPQKRDSRKYTPSVDLRTDMPNPPKPRLRSPPRSRPPGPARGPPRAALRRASLRWLPGGSRLQLPAALAAPRQLIGCIDSGEPISIGGPAEGHAGSRRRSAGAVAEGRGC